MCIDIRGRLSGASDKVLIVFFILILGAQHTNSQTWGTLSIDNFNGLTYESCYPSGGDAFWTNCNASSPRNSLINGPWEVGNTTLGATQMPTNAAGGRFLMYWTNSANTTGNNVFFRKTITNAVIGQPYRISFKIGALNAGNRPAISLRRIMNSTTTTIYSETDANFPTLNWTNISYAGSGNTGAATMQFIATATTFTLEWLNAETVTSGNDFAIDDILIETPVYLVSGIVYDDYNGITGGANGSVLQNVSVTLYASDGVTPVASTTTNASGIYSFTNRLPASYYIAVSPLAGYSHVSSTDASPTNGITNVTITNADVSNINFGINQPPVANVVSQTIDPPTSFQIPQGTITQAVSGVDPGVGVLSNGNTVIITALPSNGTLYYNGNPLTVGTSISNFSSSLLSVGSLLAGSSSTQFSYTFIDAAGLQGLSANFVVSWNTILPIQWGPIVVKQTNQGKVLIEWSTYIELNNKGFVIEYSTDGLNWIQVGFEESKAYQGNSANKLVYSFIHFHPQSGNNYYRLKQRDVDGKYEYSVTKLVRLDFADVELTIYPNPTTAKVFIKTAETSKIKSIYIYDLLGRIVERVDGYNMPLNISNHPQGVYLVKIIFKNGNQKVIKIKKK